MRFQDELRVVFGVLEQSVTESVRPKERQRVLILGTGLESLKRVLQKTELPRKGTIDVLNKEMKETLRRVYSNKVSSEETGGINFNVGESGDGL